MNSASNNSGFLIQRTVKTTQTWNYLFVSLFLLLGLTFIVAGTWRGIESLRLVTSGVHASGVVIDSQMHKSHDSKGNISTFYDTTIDFQSSDGAKHEFHDQIAGVRGQNVEVVYLEKNPETVLVFSFSNLWFLPGGFIFLGSIFFVLMLYLLVSMRKRDKEIGRLIDSGIRGVGIIVGAIQIGQGSTLVNGRRMQIFKIVVKTTDPSNKKELQINSDCICISLNIASITDIVGKEVPVYFDQNNSSSYFVELRDIEQYDINLAPNQPSS